MDSIKLGVLPLLLLIMLFVTNNAAAYTCFVLSPSNQVTNAPTSILIQEDLAVGDKIETEMSTDFTSIFKCSDVTGIKKFVFGLKSSNVSVSTLTSPNGAIIYNTNISGIGYTLSGRCNNKTQNFITASSTYYGSNNSVNLCQKVINETKKGPVGTTLQTFIQLYKTGPISGSGSLSIGTAGNFAPQALLSSGGNTNPLPSGTPLPTITVPSITLQQLSCNLDSSNINVNLGTIQALTFTGPGSTSTPVPFSIGLQCNPGTKVSLKLEAPHTNTFGGQGVLDLNAGGASGVGIQLFYPDGSNTPVSFGTTKSIGTTPSGADPTVFNSYPISLKARYYQTDATVTSGTANGDVNFTLTYQ